MNSYHPLLRDEQEWYLANASVTPTIEKLFFLRGPYRSDTGNQAYELHHQTYVYGYGPLYAQLARSKELESRNIPRARQVLHAVNILDWGHGHLNHLPPQDKKILSTAFNLWIRNLVIRQRVEDFKLGIESYQTQQNLTKPRWDATGFEFKYDFTVIDTPRAITFRDKYEEILLKMNLPDHRSVLTDPEDQVMVEMEIPRSSGVNSQPHAHT
ncbi:hypothetical protein Tco_1114205 [Tanacetum coccineum]|uniref:Uncharacterized protein n=1 Tax=Tanacetum coccineum TaxID=301880 RepID=A0ABQ5IUE3_9ASTR